MCTFGYLPPSLTFCQSVCTLRWELMSDSDIPPLFLQEAPLPQTDRATRYVSQNLVDCRNRLYNKYTTNRSSGVRGLQLIDLLWTATTGRLSYRCRQRIRPSTTTTTSFFYIAMLCIRGTSHGPVSVRLSVRLSVCPSHDGVSLKRLIAGSHKPPHTIAQGL